MKYHTMHILATLLEMSTPRALSLAKELSEAELAEFDAKHAAKCATYKKDAAITAAETFINHPNIPPPMSEAESGEHEKSAKTVAEQTPNTQDALADFLEREIARASGHATVRQAIEAALNEAKHCSTTQPTQTQRELVEEWESRMREANAARQAEKMGGEHAERKTGETFPRILRINQPRSQG